MNSSLRTLLPSVTLGKIRDALAQVPTVGELHELAVPPRICGVYFLLLAEEVVYVGQSRNIVARIHQHIDDLVKDFDRVLYLPCPPGLLDYFESRLIKVMRPRYNVAYTLRRPSTSRLVVHALCRAPEGLTFDEIVIAAEQHKVWAQTRTSLKANLRRALESNPRIWFSETDQRYRILDPAREVCGCQNRESFVEAAVFHSECTSTL
jgi:hypothetical protein